mmetsp:Transcript_41659/g.54869  ORF Transcript_41659/g.54869 Transcript_41659/m.54869 type:complete len:145 (+) Transcript_41659:131-565(+)
MPLIDSLLLQEEQRVSGSIASRRERKLTHRMTLAAPQMRMESHFKLPEQTFDDDKLTVTSPVNGRQLPPRKLESLQVFDEDSDSSNDGDGGNPCESEPETEDAFTERAKAPSEPARSIKTEPSTTRSLADRPQMMMMMAAKPND